MLELDNEKRRLSVPPSRTYGEVVQILDQLPPFPQRVFRGQTKQSDTLYPSALRGTKSSSPDLLWLATIVATLSGHSRWGPEAGGAETFYIWGPALMQHYGARSRFLDVTNDLPTAIWFALHKWYSRNDSLLDFGDLPRYHNFAWYEPLREIREAEMLDFAPVIYVFDPPVWDHRTLPPPHGSLVKISETNWGASTRESAPRIWVQSASLLYADPRHETRGNLIGAARLTIRLALDFDWSSVPGVNRFILDLFPSPKEDPFYNALLDLPMKLNFGPPRFVEHPLSIPCYIPQDPDRPTMRETLPAGTGSFLIVGSSIGPPLYAEILRQPSHAPADVVGLMPESCRYIEATPILLEAPLWNMTPDVRVSKGLWIQSALPLGIADEINGFSTHSVYIEFSPLDKRGIQFKWGTRYLVLRGVWVIRHGNLFAVVLCWLEAGDKPSFAEMRFEYDEAIGIFRRIRAIESWAHSIRAMIRARFADDDKGPAEWIGLKALFVVLTALRDMSPGYKPPAHYNIMVEHIKMPARWAEPQLAIAEVAENAYLIPKALDGGPYTRPYRMEQEILITGEDMTRGLPAIERYLHQLRDDCYLAFAGQFLGPYLMINGNPSRAMEVLVRAVGAARRAGLPDIENALQEIMDQMPQSPGN